MKTLLLSTTLMALALGALPAAAADGFGQGTRIAGASAFAGPGFDADVFERRGRGRGGDDHQDDDHGGDDDHGDGDDDDSGRDRPRVPGGSGCDDPHDVIEHPECRL